MTSSPPSPASSAALLEQLLGFRFEPTRRDDIESALRERMLRRGLDGPDAYAALLADPVQRTVEARSVADRLTVNETYFFREPEHYAVLCAHFARLAEHVASATLRVLSVGCSTGEEPYSIALMLREAGFREERVHVHACDASPAVIARAERGVYSEWSLRHASEATRARYFVRTREGYVLAEDVRRSVRFEVRNLLDADDGFWRGPSFDAVVCRNVLIYLTRDASRRALQHFAQVLTPRGILLLGHSEMSHASTEFTSVQAHGSFYFVRRAVERASSHVALSDHVGHVDPAVADRVQRQATARPRALAASQLTSARPNAAPAPRPSLRARVPEVARAALRPRAEKLGVHRTDAQRALRRGAELAR